MSWSSGSILQPSLALLLLLAATCACAQGKYVSPGTRLGCYLRQFLKDVTIKPHVTETGEVIECSGQVPINACFGLCMSTEIGDYKMPYKTARHNVCSYERFEMKRVVLDCPGHPKPFAQVLDAMSCLCQECNSDYTSCQQLQG